MAKTKALTWDNIFQNSEIYQVATNLTLPIERLQQLNSDDKILPIRGLRYFLPKSLIHRHMAETYFTNPPHIISDTIGQTIGKICCDQVVYEQIGLSYELLFKALASVEYKQFEEKHYISDLYRMLEDKKITGLILESIKEQWSDINDFLKFMDYIVDPKRRYFSYDRCHTLEDYIANRCSQSFPISESESVGVEPLLKLFMKIYEPAEEKARGVYNTWMRFIKVLEKAYPKRFERLEQQWSK